MQGTRGSDSSENGEAHPTTPGPPVVGIKRTYSANECAKDKEREYEIASRVAYWTKITGIGTVIAAILAAIAAIAFWNQLWTMQADQRPIISDDDTPVPGIKWGPEYNTVSHTFAWNYAIRNFGKSTAFNIRSFEYISVNNSHLKIIGDGRGRVTDELVPSRALRSTAFYPDPISQEELNKAVTAGAIVVKVVVKYQDASGTPYEWLICYINNPNGSIAICSRD